LLAHILVGGFDPFQNAPPEVMEQSDHFAWTVQNRTGYKRKLPALEIAIISESKTFLSSSACQKVVTAIYEGRVIYVRFTPSQKCSVIKMSSSNELLKSLHISWLFLESLV
jgi:hypothetical protein